MRFHQAATMLLYVFVFISLIACGGGANTNSNSSSSSGSTVFTGFASRFDLPSVGTRPPGIALADFNGDGNLDIATPWQSNQIAIYLGRGDGSFRAPVITKVDIANNLGNIAVGDFNEDGHPDIVAATVSGFQSDVVFLGKGDGTFQAPTTIPNSFGFFNARVIDVNGDKHQDLVTSANGSNWVFLGKGDGAFTAPPALPPNASNPGTYLGLAVGDFNGDKKVDFVVADAGYGTGSLDFYAGNGDGTFQPPILVSALSYGVGDMCTSDFNGDGKLDLLIGFAGPMEWMMLGDGNGSFRNGENFFSNNAPGPQSGFSVAAADFNLDGHPDVVTADFESGTVAVLLNDGSGQFGIGFPPTPNFSLVGLTQTSRVVAADVNNDGVPDILTVSAVNNLVSVFLATKR